jgi:HEAT repeat protein
MIAGMGEGMLRRVFGFARRRSARKLTAICETYWDSLDFSSKSTSQADAPVQYQSYRRAVEKLSTHGEEIRDWARRMLGHRRYDAREQAAYLLGQLGARGELGDAEDAIIDELDELAHWDIAHDGKERQAIDAAVQAIGAIGNRRGVEVLRKILGSDKEHHQDETAWTAAEALGLLLREPFMQADDPVAAARAWLKRHRHNGTP